LLTTNKYKNNYSLWKNNLFFCTKRPARSAFWCSRSFFCSADVNLLKTFVWRLKCILQIAGSMHFLTSSLSVFYSQIYWGVRSSKLHP